MSIVFLRRHMWPGTPDCFRGSYETCFGSSVQFVFLSFLVVARHVWHGGFYAVRGIAECMQRCATASVCCLATALLVAGQGGCWEAVARIKC